MARFQELQCFVAVVETGSFTAASDRLDLAKSAVSRRVGQLEARLSAQLLNRTTRALDLTETGRAFYERAVRILADLDEAEAAVAQNRGALAGTLRVALPLSFGVLHAAAPIQAFLSAHPDVDLHLDLNDRRVDLITEGLDLALRIGRLQDSTLIARHLFDARLAVCASPAYLAAHGTPTHPSELADHVTAVYSNVPDPDQWVFEDADGDPVRVGLAPRIRASNGDVLVAIAARGEGIVLQPTFMLADAVGNGELVPILTDFNLAATPAYAVYPYTRHLSYRVRAFIDHLADWFSGPLPWDAICDGVSPPPEDQTARR